MKPTLPLLGSLSIVAVLGSAATVDATASTTTETTVAAASVPPSAPPAGTATGDAGTAAATGEPESYMTGEKGLTVAGTDESLDGVSYSADAEDTSAVVVSDGGHLVLTNATVATSGASSSADSSSFYGLDSGVIALAGSTLTMSDSSVTTTGDGANAIFATGEGASVTLDGVTVEATGQYAHGIMATQGGAIIATDVDINTTGANSAPIATDRGSGIITVTGGVVSTAGADSPGIYSTGVITVGDVTVVATGAEAAVIEGSNSIELTDSDLTGSLKSGVMLYQSFSGDAEGSDGRLTMTGGSLSAVEGPLFYVTNVNGTISLSGVALAAGSGVLLDAGAGDWGDEGSNGGNAVLDADAQTLDGDVTVDDISAVAINLANGSEWTGAANTEATAGAVTVAIDDRSAWSVTADSYVTALAGLTISGSTVANIVGNGHTVYYDADAAANSELGGETFELSGGGTLAPA